MQIPINEMYFMSIPQDEDYTIPHKLDRRCKECYSFDVDNNKRKIGYTLMCDCSMNKKCIFTTPLDESMFEDDYSLEEYIKENHKSIFDEYKRYINRNVLPKIGENVITLRAGFGGMGNDVRKVKDVGDKYITLTNGRKDYLSSIETWYKDMKILKN